jgi:hypothetical protein
MFVALLAVTSALSCTVEEAHYKLRTAPDVTARFQDVKTTRDASGVDDWPGHVAFGIHLQKANRTFWFLPWPGGTDGLLHLASTTDINASDWKPPNPDDGPRPLGDLDYLATDAQYTFLDHIPRRGEEAPAHILLENLGSRMGPWEPKQFFDLVACTRGS